MHFKMSSAICFNLDQSKILLSGNGVIIPLTNSHIFFMTLSKKLYKNIVGKEDDAGNHHFLLFPQCFPPCEREISPFKQELNCHLQIL